MRKHPYLEEQIDKILAGQKASFAQYKLVRWNRYHHMVEVAVEMLPNKFRWKNYRPAENKAEAERVLKDMLCWSGIIW